MRVVSKCNDERWPHKREVIFYGARGVQREKEVYGALLTQTRPYTTKPYKTLHYYVAVSN